MHIAFISTLDGKNHSPALEPEGAYASTTAAALELHALDAAIAAVFAAPVPTSIPVAAETSVRPSHHVAVASGVPAPLHVFGAISYVVPPEIRKIRPPPGPVPPNA